ncbi:Phage baseplate assembly protein V [Vibrio crassostreae]|uniref:phage baseplate assembly protein V n=1 Tax=Vibrio crassostreae TaxID=246167 RepID=UPI00104D0F40|nr:phage baseplate assembly protein V [Vibrio crassostreae]TCT58297.1 phage baseplate assembly protein V [Vibrio crassostreae]TCT79112.1 phage baseplate assembly protein V [Vibrio crassostreae]CAK1775793.1 Phage baseplate assembly protein V [Vibrio crassostreae]CAK1781505.1 Phage baseplate assembly protein V [Vibrio crassostreae]CAK2171085.1 Phage baseplate assembly protein V [Vibrio crassostreae]
MFNKLAEIKTKLSDVRSMLRKLVCIGKVSKVDAELRRVKVTFPGLRYPESDWLPVLGLRSTSVSISCNLEPGEQVLCLFIPSGSMMSGFVLGSMANKSAKPYIANVDKFGVRFKDGTLLEYDQSSATGVLKIKGSEPALIVNESGVTIDSPKYTVNAPTILLNGQTHITKALTGDMTATFTGLVGAAGYGSTTGGAAVMSSGATMKGSVTINGVTVAVISHKHNDAEGRPTSTANQ